MNGAPAIAAVAVNLNGDGADDFVTADRYGNLSVLLGDSSGYLQGPTGSFYTADDSYGLAAGVVNGDGANDLVPANFYGHSVGGLLGYGSGGFSVPTNYDADGHPVSIALLAFTHHRTLSPP